MNGIQENQKLEYAQSVSRLGGTKKRTSKYNKEYYQKNKLKFQESLKRWSIKNKDKLKLYNNSYREKHPLKYLIFRKMGQINYRCNNNRCTSYIYYGGKGIKNLITYKELTDIAIRDKALLMKRPSVDRINNKKNYTFENCRFVEWSENSRRGRPAKFKDNKL